MIFRKVIIAATFVSLLLTTSLNGVTPTDAQYCAFEVVIRSPNGTPISQVPIEMVEHHRSTYSDTRTNKDGIALLCDSPVGSVDIVAGFDICGSVMIRNVQPDWPRTVRLHLTYVPMECDHFATSPQVRVVLRITAEDGRPLAGARFSGRLGGKIPAISDSFGRIMGSIRRGSKVEGTIQLDGHKSASVSEVGVDDVELKLLLLKE